MSNYIDSITAQIKADRQKASETAQTERTRLAVDMQSKGVNHVYIFFSGSGDSGFIEEVIISMQEGFEEPEEFKKQLEDFTYQWLEGTGIDWYNNDGGQGSLEFDLTTIPPSFSANVETNTTVSDTALEIKNEVA